MEINREKFTLIHDVNIYFTMLWVSSIFIFKTKAGCRFMV